jgi:glutamate formiminotransferase
LKTDNLNIAKRIAGEIRQSAGGLRSVRAIGVPLKSRGIVQVSMNLTNFRETSIKKVFDVVTEKAGRQGVEVLESEIVGLVPADALRGISPRDLKIPHYAESIFIENHL